MLSGISVIQVRVGNNIAMLIQEKAGDVSSVANISSNGVVDDLIKVSLSEVSRDHSCYGLVPSIRTTKDCLAESDHIASPTSVQAGWADHQQARHVHPSPVPAGSCGVSASRHRGTRVGELDSSGGGNTSSYYVVVERRGVCLLLPHVSNLSNHLSIIPHTNLEARVSNEPGGVCQVGHV